MNTWLHHPEFVYSEALRNWIKSWEEGGLLARATPDVGLLPAFAAGLIDREVLLRALVEGKEPRALLQWPKPVHFIWGAADDNFEEAWGRKWAKQMNASFDAIPEAAHFLQNTHGSEVVYLLLARIAEE